MKGDVATCGRWQIMRQLNSGMSLNEFKKTFLDLPKNYGVSPDSFVTYLTNGSQ